MEEELSLFAPELSISDVYLDILLAAEYFSNSSYKTATGDGGVIR